MSFNIQQQNNPHPHPKPSTPSLPQKKKKNTHTVWRSAYAWDGSAYMYSYLHILKALAL